MRRSARRADLPTDEPTGFNTTQRRRGPRALVWCIVWALCSVVTIGLQTLADPQRDGARWLTPIANITRVITLPGEVVWRITAKPPQRLTRAPQAWPAMLSWAGWLGGVWVVRRIRRAVIGQDRGGSRWRVPFDPSRRRVLVDGVAGLAAVPAAGATVSATLVGPWDLRVQRDAIEIDDLPIELDGLRIVQITDTHLGPKIPASFIAEAVARALALKPDLFVLTGDYIHSETRWIRPAAALFRPLVESGVPVLGVLGNHDWWAAGDEMRAELERIGVRMIDNGRVFFDAVSRRVCLEVPSRGLCVAGLGDLLTHTIDPRRALGGVPGETPRLVLAHVPDTAEDPRVASVASPRIDLMLSGHTHGGQVRIPGLGTPIVPSKYGQKYAAGLVHGPRFRVLVSRGVGMSILPVRLGVPPEINEITLLVAARDRG